MFKNVYGFFSIGFIEVVNLIAINQFVGLILQVLIAVLTIIKLSCDINKHLKK